MFIETKEGKTHAVCEEQLKKYGGKAKCCLCNVHDGCTLQKKYIGNDKEMKEVSPPPKKNSFSPYPISRRSIREMKSLMIKLEKKKFTEDDLEMLGKLSARFTFISVAIKYTDTYTLVK